MAGEVRVLGVDSRRLGARELVELAGVLPRFRSVEVTLPDGAATVPDASDAS